MKKIIHTFTYSLILLSIPSVSFAAPLEGVKGLLTGIKDVIDLFIPVMFGLAVLYFFWGLGQFILKDAGNDKTRAEGKQKILWGLIAIFVMASLYGIIHFVGGALGIPADTSSTNVVNQACSGDGCLQ